jgi:hypothetical protein
LRPLSRGQGWSDPHVRCDQDLNTPRRLEMAPRRGAEERMGIVPMTAYTDPHPCRQVGGGLLK